jgi:3-oxoacyl-(acyl-carrier-protein) synthase
MVIGLYWLALNCFDIAYPTINIDRLDPEIDLDVCPNHPIHFQVNCLMKNAFGFGGVNTACILKKYTG